VPVELGGQKLTLNWTKALEAKIRSPIADSLWCTVVVTSAGKEVARDSKLLIHANGEYRAENLIVNGSFEDGPAIPANEGFLAIQSGSDAIKGWRITKGSVVYCGAVGRWSWQQVDGKASVDLRKDGAIAQTFPSQKGLKYRVTFSMAGNPHERAELMTLGVSAASAKTEFQFDMSGKTAKNMGWVSKSWDFVAAGDQTTLEFASVKSGPTCGPTIDKISVVPVAE
jgi:choice-of-anchor C domain-containing protein